MTFGQVALLDPQRPSDQLQINSANRLFLDASFQNRRLQKKSKHLRQTKGIPVKS